MIALLNPIIAILETPDRFHSIIYEERPLPGGAGPMRHKSKMHHTQGHATKEECVADIHEQLVPKLKEHGMINTVALCLEQTIPWDGDGVPAMVNFFEIVDGKARVFL